MATMAEDQGARLSPRLVVAVVVGAGLLLVLAALAYQAQNIERIFPGVRVGDVAVGGLTPDEAVAALAARPGLVAATITLRDPEDGRVWQRSAEELGLSLAPEILAERAYEIGRGGANPLARLFHPLLFPLSQPGVSVSADFDAQRAAATLAELAPEVDVAPQNAGVEEQDGRLVAVAGRLGRQLDISGTVRALSLLAAAPVSDTLDVALRGTAARVPDLENVADAYNLVISGPLDVGWRNVARFTVPQEVVASWVRVADLPNETGDIVPAIVFDRAAMAAWVAERRDQIDRPPANARFGFDETGQVAVVNPGHDGLTVDVEGSVDALVAAAYTDVRVGELAVDETPAAVAPTALSQMRDVTAIARASTSVAGAPSSRVRNLLAAAAALDGAAVAPGAAFSFNAALGLVDESAGFDPVFVTEGGPDSVISQACTTLLRTAWWAGLPILERHAPPTRQGWVEPPVGLDCAVQPDRDQDFVLLNDTASPLLFDTELDGIRNVLTVTLYGQPTNRQVDVVGPEVGPLTPPPAPRVVREPRLPAGTREQVAWAREGGEVRLERVVREGSRVTARDAWTSRYAPAGDVVVVGSGE